MGRGGGGVGGGPFYRENEPPFRRNALTPIFIVRQADSHESLEFPIRAKHAPLRAGVFHIGRAQTDPVRFKRGFEEGLLKYKFAFLRLIQVLCLRGKNCLHNAIFISKKGPVLNTL